MKSSCRSLKLSIVLGVFFIISTIILSILSLKCSNEVIDIILNISIGLIGSTMVALLLYYDLTDCSKNATARNEIQKNTKWLEEKGTVEEQIEYLKGNCIFKLFISPSIRKMSNSKCYKFIIKEGEE